MEPQLHKNNYHHEYLISKIVQVYGEDATFLKFSSILLRRAD